MGNEKRLRFRRYLFEYKRRPRFDNHYAGSSGSGKKSTIVEYFRLYLGTNNIGNLWNMMALR